MYDKEVAYTTQPRITPKRLVTAEAYLSATFGPNISDFFDSSFHLVSIVRE